jgi:uncharacterized protein (TIGR03382 family)
LLGQPPLRPLLLGMAMACASRALAAGITDESAHAPPPIALPAAGGAYIDPVFGTRVLRVTDERHGRRCVHAYSYWPALNRDATRLLLTCDDVPVLYRFDGTGTSPDGKLAGDDGPRVQASGASWSHAAPDVIYALDGRRLWRPDVSRRGAAGAEVVRDFSGLFAYPHFLAQLSMAADDRTFTFHSRDPATGAKLDAVVYDTATDEIRVFPRGDYVIDESAIDKSGRWVVVQGDEVNPGFQLWDLQTGDVLRADLDDADARPGGHSDLGRTLLVNSDGFETGLIARRYEAPLGAANLRPLVRYRHRDGRRNWSIADHVSLRADAETFVVASTYAGDGSWSAFEDEIFLAYTDGSGFVRLAHTRSVEASPNRAERYFAQPRAVVDRSGRYVVYTSDLGSATRTDVLLLTIPEALWPTAGSTPKPSPPLPSLPPPAPAPALDGCAAGGRGAAPPVAALALALVLMGRRRRRLPASGSEA